MAGETEKHLFAAKKSFQNILNDLSSSEADQFYDWIENSRPAHANRPCNGHQQQHAHGPSSRSISSVENKKVQTLDLIAKDLRDFIPLEGVLKTENIIEHNSEKVKEVYWLVYNRLLFHIQYPGLV